MHDLIEQIEDARLRERLRQEWEASVREKKFGLVFEPHLPELLPLPKVKPRRGDLVCMREGSLKDLWRVRRLANGVAFCVKPSPVLGASARRDAPLLASRSFAMEWPGTISITKEGKGTMNPAERILTIYDKLMQRHNDGPMQAVWSEVFEVPSEGPHVEDDITACLVALRAEIQLTRTLLAEHDVPARLHGPGLDRLHAAASPGLLNNNWHSHRGNVLPPENRVSLDWACWALQDESEGAVAEEERKALIDEVTRLENHLEGLALSPYMRAFVQRQLDVIRRALRVYGIQGVAPMRTALRQVVGDFKVEESRLKAEQATATPEAKSAWSSATAIIEKTAKLADQGSKLKKGAEDIGALAGAVYEQAGAMLGAVKPLLLSFVGNGTP